MNEIGSFLKRPCDCSNVDGAGELGFGFLFASMSLYQWLQIHTPLNSIWSQMYTFYFSLALIVPATISMTVVGVVAMFVWHLDLTITFSLIGLGTAARYARALTRAKAVRWKWAVACAVVCGSITIALLPADLTAALARNSWVTARIPATAVGTFWLYEIFFGTTLLISGGIRPFDYLHAEQQHG